MRDFEEEESSLLPFLQVPFSVGLSTITAQICALLIQEEKQREANINVLCD